MLGVVDSVAIVDTLATTYNFEVENTHTYFVGTGGVLVHNSCTVEDVISNIQNITHAGNYNFKIENLSDCHKISAGIMNVNVADFTAALNTRNIVALNNMGFDIEVLGRNMLGISKDNVRYRTPIVKRNGDLQGNIEIKPTNITWEDVNNKNPSSPRFVEGADTIINHHLTVDQ
jgi:hypothetical protein